MARTAIKPNRLSHINRDRGYRFNDQDPKLIELCTIITRSGLDIGDILERILDVSKNSVHISYSTIANWQSGKTRRPQNWTMDWVAYALGYERGIWSPIDGRKK